MFFKETFKACDAPKHIKLSKNIYGGKSKQTLKKYPKIVDGEMEEQMLEELFSVTSREFVWQH